MLPRLAKERYYTGGGRLPPKMKIVKIQASLCVLTLWQRDLQELVLFAEEGRCERLIREEGLAGKEAAVLALRTNKENGKWQKKE